MGKEPLDHLEVLRKDTRDEIKRRIEQRDKYSIQMTIALGALIAVSFSSTNSPDLRMVLIAVPLVSLYFTVLILYSYRVHKVLATYLKDKIEPKLAEGYSIDLGLEWENYYKDHEVQGIRRWFFLVTLWAVTGLSLGYLWYIRDSQTELNAVLTTMTYFYGAMVIFTTIWDFNILNLVWRKIVKTRSKDNKER
jgi:FtsH-binding integral membrane protein